jgi:hypothetical protein
MAAAQHSERRRHRAEDSDAGHCDAERFHEPFSATLRKSVFGQLPDERFVFSGAKT